MNAKKISRTILASLVGLFLFGAGGVYAYYNMIYVNADAFRLLYQGAVRASLSANSSGDVIVTDLTGNGGSGLTIKSGTGGLMLKSYSSTDLSSLIPVTTGEMVLNSTYGMICRSTGAVDSSKAGAWVHLATSPTSILLKCW